MELRTAVKLAWQPLKIGSCVSDELSVSCFIPYEHGAAADGVCAGGKVQPVLIL